MVTVADLLELVGKGGVHEERTTPRALLHHRVPHRKRHVAAGAW
jgi:hypothetical protein